MSSTTDASSAAGALATTRGKHGAHKAGQTVVVIDWPVLMHQVLGDEAFLIEILTAFNEEAYECSLNILHGIDDIHFHKCFKASHQILGTSSYLACYDLQNRAKHVQDLAAEGSNIGKFDEATNEPMKWKDAEIRHADHIWADLRRAYKKFGKSLKMLSEEINKFLMSDSVAVEQVKVVSASSASLSLESVPETSIDSAKTASTNDKDNVVAVAGGSGKGNVSKAEAEGAAVAVAVVEKPMEQTKEARKA